ncbi:ABC-type antimicrobial peptide transport system, ATPase component [Thioflavicoccus mobilis 8321]|uniref:ABC-type antimicrobial peptide transport system, ATPase component n=1 Tax=Thioflavicoccus mobilis 8321 TaxID=765912 RepID=L0GTY5_9GAMM|nr:ABC transporter ATP-binding protein [Thioflavicoccus mobilis]AGA90223.1 ABC-type antimicrobial peptide transport system, ATPase component [Thioflavicoccus mobilis 8321]
MIELEGIQRIFKVGDEEVAALSKLDLRFETGAYAAIMGPSGSGKSTLLNILGLLDRPDAGVYRLDGIPTTDLSDNEQAEIRGHKIGFVFQSFHLIPRLTAAENVQLPLMLAGVAPDERKRIVSETLESMGLTDRAHHRPDQLSGGQRQRVAIARAVIMQPSIILADEPTGNLDHASGASVIEILESLNRQGITLLIVTHDPEVGKRAQRQVHLLDGKVVFDGAPAEHHQLPV